VKMRPIPRAATLSYMSPLARAVLTPGPGETVEMTGGDAVILDVAVGERASQYCLMRKDRSDRGRKRGPDAQIKH